MWLFVVRQPWRWSNTTLLRGSHRMRLPNHSFNNLKSDYATTVRLQNIGVCLPGVKEVSTSWTDAKGKVNTEGLRVIGSSFHFLTRLDVYDSKNITVWSPLSTLHNLEELLASETMFGDSGLESVSQLTHLRDLKLCNTPITDEGLSHISSLLSLTSLHLTMTGIGDGGLKKLAGLVNLQDLDVRYSKVTGEGLVHLASMASLKMLSVGHCEGIGDEGVIHILNLQALEDLNMDGTGITDAGITRLWAGLPMMTDFWNYGGVGLGEQDGSDEEGYSEEEEEEEGSDEEGDSEEEEEEEGEDDEEEGEDEED